MTTSINPELSNLIRDVIEANLLKPGSAERDVAERVASLGQGSLDAGQREIYEQRVLPILAKPIRDQLAIASIVQRGGYVPRKIRY